MTDKNLEKLFDKEIKKATKAREEPPAWTLSFIRSKILGEEK